MSVYEPNPKDLYADKGPDGRWYVYDKHGVYDGPYTCGDACAVVAEARLALDAAKKEGKR